MAPQSPKGTINVSIAGLGEVKGLEFANGVRQFTGIPYANLAKRWTRSTLKTSWADKNGFHDGTKLGPSAPNPPEYNRGPDLLIPVPPVEHHGIPIEDELRCLVMNITIPPANVGEKLPVMLYIHGGSFLYGGANRSIFDGVNFVSHSLERGTPVIAINFNYRVGLGGFLASTAIKADLERDGFDGVGNFGLYDQQVAIHWVNRYVSLLGGDPENITLYGESAGGMSVSHQIAAKQPAPFQRAIAMSGHLNTIPTWSLERHEQHYRALLEYLKIDPNATDALEQLRKVPQDVIAAATIPVEGVFVCTGNPCDDGVFHAKPPSFDGLEAPPSWLKAYMVGDTLDEGMIFRMSLAEETPESIRARMMQYLAEADVDRILGLYAITPQTKGQDLIDRMETLAGDVIFRVHNWVTVHKPTTVPTYGYHFDQASTFDHALKGLAYHAIDLMYVFLNYEQFMTPEQRMLARQIASDFQDYAYGKEPWAQVDGVGSWAVYGPNDACRVLTEQQDEPVRRYARTKEILDMGVYPQLLGAVDEIVCKRWRMGTFETSLN